MKGGPTKVFCETGNTLSVLPAVFRHNAGRQANTSPFAGKCIHSLVRSGFAMKLFA